MPATAPPIEETCRFLIGYGPHKYQCVRDEGHVGKHVGIKGAPLITLAGDTPRARRSDPLQSHEGADVSSFRRRKVLLAVLEILREDGEQTGTGMNADYRSWQVVWPFPRCHPESPRKRLQEAASECLADVVGHRKSAYGTSEAVYAISVEGRALLNQMGI